MVTSEPPLATLYELQTAYDVAGLYNLLEIIEARETLKEIAHKKVKAEIEAKKNNPKGKRGR